MKTLNYIVIEDENLVARMLIEMITKLRPNYRLLQVIGSVNESVSYFDNNPDTDALIFMDIALSDGKCFDIFERCTINNPIIFTTSHDEWAIKAFKVNSIDYLLKPVEEDELLQAIMKYESHVSMRTNHDALLYEKLLATIDSQNKYHQRLLINYGNRYITIDTDSIAFFDADDKYVSLHSIDGKEYLVDYKLKELTEMLPPATFYRLSRSCIASRNIIREVKKTDQGRLKIYFKPPYQERVEIVSALNRNSFLGWYGR